MSELEAEYDVLVVGAGISGIGAAYHLQTMGSGCSFAVFESRSELGGTWSFFKYPGLRSDSDMLTFGYSFYPWTRPEILAPANLILDYLRSVVKKFGLAKYIHYSTSVTKASWSSEQTRWTLTVKAPDGSTREISAKYLFMCGGYYIYDKGNTPHFEGRETFKGEVVHPQAWESNGRESVRVAGKNVAVIGSGATAVTLVPELVKEGAAHVTCVQRSPSYLMDVWPKDWFMAFLRFFWVPQSVAANLARWRNIWMHHLFYQFCVNFPVASRYVLQAMAWYFLGINTDMVHWTPKYDPWKQRVCAVVNGDIFRAISTGGASMATGDIECFTPSGLRLTNGTEVAADLIVTATGMNMQRNLPMSWIETTVDGTPFVASEHMTYKGLMLSRVPNLFYSFGYANSSWTLKSDLIARFVCRIIAHMELHDFSRCEPIPADDVIPQPAVGPLQVLTSGYLQRVAELLPRQGSRGPWQSNHNYFKDLKEIDQATFDDQAASEIFFRK